MGGRKHLPIQMSGKQLTGVRESANSSEDELHGKLQGARHVRDVRDRSGRSITDAAVRKRRRDRRPWGRQNHVIEHVEAFRAELQPLRFGNEDRKSTRLNSS